jgi:hypothetical protein
MSACQTGKELGPTSTARAPFGGAERLRLLFTSCHSTKGSENRLIVVLPPAESWTLTYIRATIVPAGVGINPPILS